MIRHTTINNYDKLDNLHLTLTYIVLNINTQKYFNIHDLRKVLAYGILSFKIDILKNSFLPGTLLKALIIDSKGNTIFTKYYPVIIDFSRLITIILDKTVSLGPAVLTILGQLRNSLVPIEWHNKINIKFELFLIINPYLINKSPLYFLNLPVCDITLTRIQYYKPLYISSSRQLYVTGSKCYGNFNVKLKAYKFLINKTLFDISTVSQPTTLYVDKYSYKGSIISTSYNNLYLNIPITDLKYNLLLIKNLLYTLYYINNYITTSSISNYKSFINCSIYFTLISGYLNLINIYARNSGNINNEYFYVGNSKVTLIVNEYYLFMVLLPQ